MAHPLAAFLANNMSYRYGIVGSGAIGLGLAQLLNRHHCTLFIRNIAADHPADSVLSAIDANNNKTHFIATARSLKDVQTLHWQDIDLLILPVKFYQLAPLIEQLHASLPKTLALLLLQNGLGGDALLSAAFPDNPLFLASTTDAIVRLTPQQIRIHARGELIVGSHKQTESTPALQTLIESHPKAKWDANILTYLYRKLAVNAVINPLSAKYRCRNGDITQYPMLVEGLKQEVFTLYRAMSLGIDSSELNGYIDSVISLTANNYSSMYQDVINQRPTEIDSILGVLLSKAAAHKVRLPLIQTLYYEIKRAYS